MLFLIHCIDEKYYKIPEHLICNNDIEKILVCVITGDYGLLSLVKVPKYHFLFAMNNYKYRFVCTYDRDKFLKENMITKEYIYISTNSYEYQFVHQFRHGPCLFDVEVIHSQEITFEDYHQQKNNNLSDFEYWSLKFPIDILFMTTH